jgi:hypothetical protein
MEHDFLDHQAIQCRMFDTKAHIGLKEVTQAHDAINVSSIVC